MAEKNKLKKNGKPLDECDEKREPREGDIAFYPLHIMKELMVVMGVISFILILAALFPAHLLNPADPLTTPAHIKPEWYFLAIYQMLKYVPNGEIFSGFSFLSVAVLLQGATIMVLVLVPFFDHYPSKKASKRPVFLVLGIVVLTLMIVMTYLGHFSGHEDILFHHVFR